MGKWKRKARELEAENQEMDRTIANLRLDLDDRNRMIDVLYAGRRYEKTDGSEEPGDANAHGMRDLSVVIARRVQELQEWRNGWRSPDPDSVSGPMIPEERFCSGRGVHGQYIRAISSMRQWTALVASDALTCSGIAWDVCGPGPWYARDANAPHPCGALS